MQNRLSRRDVLRLGATGAAVGGVAGFLATSGLAQVPDADIQPQLLPRKLVVIFLRGGNDGLNTVVPHLDTQYDSVLRPTLYMGSGTTLALSPHAGLHPAMSRAMTVYNAGDLALLHRVGRQSASLSHFVAQQYWETADTNLANEEGYLTRFASTTVPAGLPLRGASVSGPFQQAFRSTVPARILAHIPNIDTYDLGASAGAPKLRGNTAPPYGAGLAGHFADPAPPPNKYEAFSRKSGAVFIGSEGTVTALPPYVPGGGATYPSAGQMGLPNQGFVTTFMRQVEDAAQLIRDTSCRVAGVELGGFDTHSNQGQVTGRQADRLQTLAHALESLYLDFNSNLAIGRNTIVLVVSEFGRTSRENSSLGTDHGYASVAMVSGARVNGGVYNCDPTTWMTGDVLSQNNKYVAPLTDFRCVYRDILINHLRVRPGDLDTIIPGYSGLSGPLFNSLGFI